MVSSLFSIKRCKIQVINQINYINQETKRNRWMLMAACKNEKDFNRKYRPHRQQCP
jgi:hypothetical protein